MAISYQVFKNVKTAALGSTLIYGVQSVTVRKTRREIHASADAEVFETVAEPGVCAIDGDLVLTDPVQADTLDGAAGTFSFIYEDTRSGTNKTVTILNASFASTSHGGGHNAPSNATLKFIAYSADGTTDPVSVS